MSRIFLGARAVALWALANAVFDQKIPMYRCQQIALITFCQAFAAQQGSSDKHSGCQGALPFHSLTDFLSRLFSILVVNSSALDSWKAD